MGTFVGAPPEDMAETMADRIAETIVIDRLSGLPNIEKLAREHRTSTEVTRGAIKILVLRGVVFIREGDILVNTRRFRSSRQDGEPPMFAFDVFLHLDLKGDRQQLALSQHRIPDATDPGDAWRRVASLIDPAQVVNVFIQRLEDPEPDDIWPRSPQVKRERMK
ncbi:hypothetical protein [Amycolatopsis sp. GM8]|uniref:hypothetical protein n=1 Tax=Amycolatopsis sp. GM8 TaxID=2896530 RepID=UPI001F184920|nr:hypothetical protein [Amycolatopsis sp. GM8]